VPIKVETVLERLHLLENAENSNIIKDFDSFLKETQEGPSDRHRSSALQVMISLAVFLGVKKFYEVGKEDVITFLDSRNVGGEWVKRERDPDGKWISTWNYHLTLCRTFFRWLHNRGKDRDEWETPSWFKIKNKKVIKDSPYNGSQVWSRDEVLSILKYEPELRNKAIITMMWDLSARNHEITALKIGDIRFNERYAEGEIPYTTKTGGGPIMLTMSFPYARDWKNRHPWKNEPKRPFICSRTGAPINPERIWAIMEALRLRIKRLVEEGDLDRDKHEKERMEYLLATKKWNPYCAFRHSSLTNDSDILPEYVVKKKARWTMNSRQSARYIKNTLGQDIKNKLLQNAGISIPDENKREPAVHQCQHCQYVNAFENEICEKCSLPVNQEAFEKIKKQQESRMNAIVDERLKAKDVEIQGLKEQAEEIQDLYQSLTKTLDEVADLRAKIRANPEEFLEADPFKFAAMQKRRYNVEAHT
jgi:integrase/recombinase XerD